MSWDDIVLGLFWGTLASVVVIAVLLLINSLIAYP